MVEIRNPYGGSASQTHPAEGGKGLLIAEFHQVRRGGYNGASEGQGVFDMTRQRVLSVLASRRHELQALGVKSLALFGSVVRDEATDTSDVDLLVEFDRPIGFFHFVDVKDYLERVLGVAKVDLVMREGVIEELKSDIFEEAVDVL
jgi:uncharacterized protein